MEKSVSDRQREQSIYRVTIAGSIINAVLLALKFTAGILGGSAAMIADAVHSEPLKVNGVYVKPSSGECQTPYRFDLHDDCHKFWSWLFVDIKINPLTWICEVNGVIGLRSRCKMIEAKELGTWSVYAMTLSQNKNNLKGYPLAIRSF